MELWRPPTPPHDDNDLYIDQSLCFLYEPRAMSESQLPPIYVKKDAKRQRVDVTFPRSRLKSWREDQPYVPRSLFDRPLASLKRDAAKLKFGLKAPLKPPTVTGLAAPESVPDQPEWLVPEDWALLQAVQSLLGLPLSLTSNSPALIVNWDLVADSVNALSRTYRSSKQCKNRYETVIIAREEGRILYDINPRKPKKTKGIYKTKNNRPMRTSQLFSQDAHSAITTLYTLRFDSCKAIAIKRLPTTKTPSASPPLKNPKHTAVLLESGINYDQPLMPTQIAQIKAERNSKEKEKQKTAADIQQQQQQQQQLQPQQTQQQQQSVIGQKTVISTTMPIALPTVQQLTAVSLGNVAPSSIMAQQQLIVQVQQLQLPAGAAVAGPATGTAILSSGNLQKASVSNNTPVANVTFSRALLTQASSIVMSAATLNKRFTPGLATPSQNVSVVTSTSLANLVKSRVPTQTAALTVQQLTDRGFVGQVSAAQLIAAPLQVTIESSRAAVAGQSLPASIGFQFSQVGNKLTQQQVQSIQKTTTGGPRAQQSSIRQPRFSMVTQAINQNTLQKTSSPGMSTVGAQSGPTVRVQVQKQASQLLLKQAGGSESDLKQLQQQQQAQQTLQTVRVGPTSAAVTPQLNVTGISGQTASLANAQTVATLIRAMGNTQSSTMSAINISQQQRALPGRVTIPQIRTSQLQQRSVVTTKPVTQVAQRTGITQGVRLPQGATQVVMPQQKVMIQSMTSKPSNAGLAQQATIQQLYPSLTAVSAATQSSLTSLVSKVSSPSTQLLSVVVSSGVASRTASAVASGSLTNFTGVQQVSVSGAVLPTIGVGANRTLVVQEGTVRRAPLNSVRLSAAASTVQPQQTVRQPQSGLAQGVQQLSSQVTVAAAGLLPDATRPVSQQPRVATSTPRVRGPNK